MPAIEHYLPQFLLRGFAAKAAKIGGEQHHVYQFRRGGTPHLTNVRNVAGERRFYGTVGTADVEPVLQKRENEYAPLVERLRASSPRPADKALIDAFIAHLVGRSRHSRESAVDMAASAIDASRQAVVGTEYRDQLVDVLVERGLRSPELLAKLSMLTESERQQFASLFRTQVTAAANSGVLADLGQKFHAELIGTFDLLELARAGQGDAILREPPATTTRKAFLPLTWGVKRNPGFNYVLGDVGVLAQFSDAADLVLLGRGVGSLPAAFFPQSPTTFFARSTQEGVTACCQRCKISVFEFQPFAF